MLMVFDLLPTVLFFLLLLLISNLTFDILLDLVTFQVSLSVTLFIRLNSIGSIVVIVKLGNG